MGAPPTKFPSGFDTSRVWSPAGGWFADPKAWKRNTAIGFLAAGAAAVAIFSYSRKVEVRARRRPRSSPLSARVAARRATATFSSNRSRRRARSIDRRGGFRTSERLAALFRPPIHPSSREWRRLSSDRRDDASLVRLLFSRSNARCRRRDGSRARRGATTSRRTRRRSERASVDRRGRARILVARPSHHAPSVAIRGGRRVIVIIFTLSIASKSSSNAANTTRSTCSARAPRAPPPSAAAPPPRSRAAAARAAPPSVSTAPPLSSPRKTRPRPPSSASFGANVGVELKGVRSGVERRRGRGLKARDPGRRDAPGKVLKDRRSPRRRGRTGTSVT